MDLFDLFCTISIKDEYSDGINSASASVSNFSDKLKTGLATAAKVGAAAVTAASAAVTALTKNSIEQYGEYEQLVGGAQLMFGTAYDFVAEKAANAYSTVQMSQNAYLQQINGFATGLKTALGGNEQAAAELADRIITAEADIVAATGNTQEAVQNAFNGIMKSNYTMLDNLQIGITPTKEGFQEVIDKVNEWNAANGNATNYMIDNLADAESALIDYIEMQGLAGYASAEAADTIQGSVSSMKAAWTNLVTGIADENADLDTLIGNFVGSVETAAGNVIPRITQILSGMGTAIQQLAPIIATEVPALVSSVLPQIISAGAQLAVGLATGLIGALPQLAAAVPEIVVSLSAAISESLPELTAAGTQLLSMLAAGVMTGIPLLAETAAGILVQLGQYLKENLPALLQSGLEMLDEFTGSLRENAGVLVDAALEFAKNLAAGLAAGIPTIIEQVPGIVSNIANIINDNAPKMLAAAAEIIEQLVVGLLAAIPTLVKNIPQITAAIWNVITAFNWINLGANIIRGIGNGIKSMGSFAKSSMETIKTALKDGVSKLPETFLQIGKNIIQGLINGVKSMASTAVQTVKDVGASIVSSVTDFFGIHSPSTVFKTIGQYMMEGLALGMEDSKGEVMETIEDIVGEVKNRFTALTDVLTARQDVGDLEFQLWERTIGANATDAEKYEKQLEILNAQQRDQESVVDAAAAAYEAIITQYGDSSAESYEYQKALLQEMIAYQDLIDQINEVIAAKEALASMDGVSTVSFEDSAVGRTSAATINAISDAGGAYTQDVTLNATLVAPDGTKFANYYLPSFIKAGVANGTPIASGQYA